MGEAEFESEEDEDEGAIIAGGNKAGSGDGFLMRSTSAFIEIGGLYGSLGRGRGINRIVTHQFSFSGSSYATVVAPL